MARPALATARGSSGGEGGFHTPPRRREIVDLLKSPPLNSYEWSLRNRPRSYLKQKSFMEDMAEAPTRSESEFIFGEKVGEGAFGTVRKAFQRSQEDHDDWGCLKITRGCARSEGHLVQYLAKSLQAPRVLLRVFLSWEEMASPAAFVFMEFLPGEIAPHSCCGRDASSAQRAATILFDVLTALAFLAAEFVVHRDVKPDNIRERADGDKVLCDYGRATHVLMTQTFPLNPIGLGSKMYLAPEMCRLPVENFNKHDAFAAGRTLQHILAPADMKTNWEEFDYAAAWFKPAVDGLLQPSFEDRFSAFEALQMLDFDSEAPVAGIAARTRSLVEEA